MERGWECTAGKSWGRKVNLQKGWAKYDPEHIYNADETGLFYCMEPNQTLGVGSIPGRKKGNKIKV